VENLLDSTELDGSYLERFEKLYRAFMNLKREPPMSGNLLQIFIPKDKVNDYLYLSTAYGIPLKKFKMRDEEGKEVIYKINSKGAAEMIEAFRNNPSAFDPLELDSIQGRLLLTNLFLLNPASGVKVYSYNTIQPEELARYKNELKKLVQEIMSKWAAERGVMSKQLAVTNKQSFDQKVGLLKKVIQDLLIKKVDAQTNQQAKEANNKLTTLVEIYGKTYGAPEELNNVSVLLQNLQAKFGITGS
jgi:hypothetical protein